MGRRVRTLAAYGLNQDCCRWPVQAETPITAPGLMAEGCRESRPEPCLIRHAVAGSINDHRVGPGRRLRIVKATPGRRVVELRIGVREPFLQRAFVATAQHDRPRL